MAERVEILVVAQDAASQVLRGIAGNFGEIGNMVQGLTSGRVFETLTSEIIKFGKESIDATVSYANEVRSLTMISGESAEEVSRFIQVLDDYKISASDVEAATRAMTKNGLVPNIETLAQLSDKYLAITDQQERNEFVIKNLGRAGLQWVEVLNLGSDAIRKQGAAVSDGLILNEEMLKQARELEFAQDNWNDTMQEVHLTLGTKLLPGVTDLTKYTLEASKATSEEIAAWENLLPPVRAVHTLYISVREALTGAKEATEESTQANKIAAEQHEKTKEELKAEQDAVNALTKANEEYLSLVGSLAENITSYEEKHQDIQDQLNSGKITLQEAQAEWKKLADEQEKATYRMVLNMLQQRLAVDGLDAQETQFLLNQGVQWGIYSQSAVNEANRVMAQVDQLANRYRSVPAVVQTDIVTNYVTTYGFTPAPSSRPARQRAGGGDVMAGMMYRVNETREEYFQPSMSGTVIPLGSGRGGGGSQPIQFVYAPQMSLGSAREAETIIAPYIERAIRKLQSDGKVN